jgi:hypothetical protein
MLKVQVEAETNPDNIPPEKFAEGRQAMANAIASTRRMLQALDDAARVASIENN